MERITLRQFGWRVGRLKTDEDFERVVVAREQRRAARGGEEGGNGSVLLVCSVINPLLATGSEPSWEQDDKRQARWMSLAQWGGGDYRSPTGRPGG